MDPYFHSVEVTREDDTPKNARAFTGTGNARIPVPGVVKVTYVRVGNTTLPEEISHTVLMDASGRTETRHAPMYQLSVGEDGVPVLLRNKLSNFGIWQKDETIYVGGEWEGETAAPAADPLAVLKGK